MVQAKYQEIYELIKKIVSGFTSEEIDKYAINIMITLLQIIPLKDWTLDPVKCIISDVLKKITEGKAKARKQITRSFLTLLSKPEGISTKLDDYIREFSIKCLETESREALLITFFLNPLLTKFRVSTIGDLVYAYQKLLSKSTDEQLVTHIYLTLENVQHKNPVSPDLSEGLLRELMHTQPSFYSDSKLVFAYIQCLSQTLIHMLMVDYTKGRRMLSGVLSIVSEVMLVDNRSLQAFAEKTLELVILHGVKQGFWQQNEGISFEHLDNFDDLLDLEESSKNNNTVSDSKRTISVLTHLTTSRFENVYPLVLKALGCFFGRLDNDSIDYHFNSLQRLTEGFISLRGQVHREVFSKAFGKVIAKIGLRKIIELRPINIDFDVLADDFEENSNLWILNSITQGMRNENIQLFFEGFLPLLEKIKAKGSVSNDNVRNQVLVAIQGQIWELLAGFHLDLNDSLEGQILRILEILAENLEKSNSVAIDSIVKFIANQERLLSGLTTSKKPLELAEKTIPKLVKFITVPHRSETSRFSLKSIGVLSIFCSKAYLDRVFTKNASKLLEPSIQTDIKTFEILLEVAKNLEIRSDKQEYSLKLIRKYLISQTPMQKRAYKLLYLLFSKLHPSFYPELFTLLSTKHEVQHASRPLRASVIAKVWLLTQSTPEKIGDFLQGFLSELVLGLKETNRRTRATSTKVLQEISVKMTELGLLTEFVSLLTAGFAGASGTMKAASILAFARVFEGKIHENFNEILEMIGLLMREGNREIFSAGVEYYRGLLKGLGKEELKEIASGVMGSLLDNDKENREKFRSKINYFLRKFIKRVGKDEAEKSLPEEHRKMVKAAIKAQKTEKRREKARKLKNKEMRKLKKGEKENEIEEEEIGKQKNEEEMGAEEQKERTQRKIEENPNDLLLKYDAETEKFHFIEHPLQKIKEKIQLEEEKQKKMELEMLKGKIVVREFKEETGKKRRREDEGVVTEGHGGNNNKKTLKALKGAHIVKESGETFKAKNSSHGDLKLAGKPNPYAFIQLNPQVLNKRHRNVAGKAFEQVLGKKKDEGMLKGLKSSKKVKM